jgi:hypothetical protein
MPSRTASKILAEWHELAIQRDEASDADLVDAITARIERFAASTSKALRLTGSRTPSLPRTMLSRKSR